MYAAAQKIYGLQFEWVTKNINYIKIGKIAQNVGCAAVTLHPRTAATKRSGVAKWDHIKIVKLFIFHGADINATGSDGRGPIHIAIANGNIDIVNLLKTNGASL